MWNFQNNILALNIILLVANFGNSKWKKFWKWLEPWHMGTHLNSQWVLSNEYQRDRVETVYKNLCALVLWTKEPLALKGLDDQTQVDSIPTGQPEQASLNQCQLIAKNWCSAHAQLMVEIHSFLHPI